MAKEAYYCTVKELNKLGRDAIPAQLRSNTHLIYRQRLHLTHREQKDSE